MTDTDLEQMSADAKAVAEEQSQPGTFSFLDRLNNRNYPTEDVTIFLDERAGLIVQKLKSDLMLQKDPAQREIIEKQIAYQVEKACESRYIVHLQGISVEAYDAIVDAANEQYPVEYNEFRNPLTAKLEREVIPNEDRDLYFRTHLWAAFFQSVEDKDGNLDENTTPEFVSVFLKVAPIAAQVEIGAAVDRLRMVTNWMDEIQGEDFLAKS